MWGWRTKLKRRQFIRNAALAGGAVGLSGTNIYAGDSHPPNVLLFTVDQMRQPIWFPENKKFENIERLKKRGVEFTRHFCSAVPCSPSRACLMTGLHMDQHNVFNNLSRDVQGSLDPNIPTIGNLFSSAGYRTPYFGKWHLTTGKDKIVYEETEEYGFRFHGSEYLTGDFNGLKTDPDVTDSALNWLSDKSNHDKPWFLTLSLTNPHDICGFPNEQVSPLLVPSVFDKLPDNWNDNLKGKPRCQAEYQEAYAARSGYMDLNDKKIWMQYLDYYFYLTKKIDVLFGKALDKLESLGLDQNTIVIFTSDHGDMGGSHKLRSKGPCVYKENTNIPLIVSWPGKIPQGEKSDALSQNVDIFPTMAGLIGIDAASRYPYLPGKNLTPIIYNPKTPAATDHVLYSYMDNSHLRKKVESKGGPAVVSPYHIRAIRERDWVYARYYSLDDPRQEFEMYDLKNDPLEMHNLAGDAGYTSKEREMAAKLREAEGVEMAPVKIK